MPDKARKITDKKLKKMERKISKIYQSARHDITAKWDAYMERSAERMSKMVLEYQKIAKSGTQAEIRAFQAKLTSAMENRTLRNEWYRSMVNVTAEKITHVNEVALAYVNNQMPAIYAVNYNAVASQIKNVSFTLVDEATVKNMIRKNPKLIPYKHINHKKDYLWNLKRINSSVLQGILQGEGIPQISKRLLPVVENNKASAIRNARTMTTSAENKGRYDSYKDLEDRGAIIKKVWIATPDERTRASHVELDGAEVDIDEPFETINGNKLMYPADPDGEPEEVWNCRCTTRIHFIGFESEE